MARSGRIPGTLKPRFCCGSDNSDLRSRSMSGPGYPDPTFPPGAEAAGSTEQPQTEGPPGVTEATPDLPLESTDEALEAPGTAPTDEFSQGVATPAAAAPL